MPTTTRRPLIGLAMTALVLTCASPVAAQPSPLLLATDDDSSAGAHAADQPRAEPEAVPDPLLPGEGRVALTLAGGVPFAVVGEIGVGLSDGFALGAIAGAADTMDEAAVGGRMRIGVFTREHFDIALSLPVLYYPPSDKRLGEDWLLTNPSLLLRGRPGAGIGIYGGVGAVATSCVDSLVGAFGGESHHDAGVPAKPMVDGVWNTYHAGGTVHVTAGFSAFLDTMLIARGIVPAESYADRVGPPFLAIAGGSYVF
jgi:hypothetical protein